MRKLLKFIFSSRKLSSVQEPMFGAEIIGQVCPKHLGFYIKTHSYLKINL